MRKKIQIPVVIIKKLLFFGFEKCSKKVDEAEGGGPRRAHAKMLNKKVLLKRDLRVRNGAKYQNVVNVTPQS